jgi:hypothetical protein
MSNLVFKGQEGRRERRKFILTIGWKIKRMIRNMGR